MYIGCSYKPIKMKVSGWCGQITHPLCAFDPLLARDLQVQNHNRMFLCYIICNGWIFVFQSCNEFNPAAEGWADVSQWPTFRHSHGLLQGTLLSKTPPTTLKIYSQLLPLGPQHFKGIDWPEKLNVHNFIHNTDLVS